MEVGEGWWGRGREAPRPRRALSLLQAAGGAREASRPSPARPGGRRAPHMKTSPRATRASSHSAAAMSASFL
jgi:hypothetical protein